MSKLNFDKPLCGENSRDKNNLAREETKNKLLIEDLGWSREETLEAYYRFLPFKQDWDYPGMEVYDEL